MRTTDLPGRRRPWGESQTSTSNARRIKLLIAVGVFMLGLLALAACGAGSVNINRIPTPFSTAVSTGTPGIQRYAYLYSRVDYPLQVPVNAGDTVTLTLSPQSNILTVTPGPGTGSQTIGAPIPLPTDLSLYQDIGAEADTVDTAKSPVVWQLQSPPRQSLLSAPGTGQRQYLNEVVFRWHVQALATGENSINIVLRLYYVYLDGSEHDGTIQVTQQPIPIVAVQPSPISNSLPAVKLPLAGVTWLAGFIAAIRFIWKAYQTINTVAEPVKQAAEVAVAVKKHVGGGSGGNGGTGGTATAKPEKPAANNYPNLWAQPSTWQSPSPYDTPAYTPADSTHQSARSRPLLPPTSPSSGPASSWLPNQQPPSGPPPGSERR